MKKVSPWLVRLSLFSLVVLNLTACGGSGTRFFDAVDLSVVNQNEQSYVRLSSTFNLGNVSLGEVAIPIVDPNTNQELGVVSFSNLNDGHGKIDVDVNASVLVGANPDPAPTLPNGRPLPAALNIQPGQAVTIPILEHSRVYVGGDLKKDIFLGVALGIKGLDQVMGDLQVPANVFFIFNQTPQLFAEGGVYASPQPDQNGIAVFGKYTANASAPQNLDPSADFELDRMSRKTQKRLMNFFYGEKRVLRFQ